MRKLNKKLMMSPRQVPEEVGHTGQLSKGLQSLGCEKFVRVLQKCVSY